MDKITPCGYLLTPINRCIYYIRVRDNISDSIKGCKRYACL